MSKNLDQVYTLNPITSNASTDLMYFMQSPYNPGTDAGMTYANFAMQFGAPYTAASLTGNSDTNVTITLGGSPTSALLHASSITMGWSGQLSLARGGSNANLTASNGGVVYSNATQMQILSGTATANQPLVSGASGAPSWSTTPHLTEILDNNAVEALQIGTAAGAVNWLTIGNSATGGGPTIGCNGSDSNIPISFETVGTGQYGFDSLNSTPIVINSGTTYQHTTNFIFANTAATRNVTFPDSSGTVAYTSQVVTWNDVSGTTQAAAVNQGYIISNASQTTVTIPATAAEGSVFAVQGKGAAGWILQMNTGQVCHFGSSATSSAGTLTSTNQWDALQIVCVTANTTFAVMTAMGNLTVA